MLHQTSINSSQNCIHILNKVFRSTAKQPTREVGSIRCGNCFFPVESRDCMKSASNEFTKNMSTRRGAQFVPIGMPTVCWKTFPAKTTKILSTRNSSILMMSSSEHLFLESECSFTKYVSSCPKTKYLYLRLPFLKMKAFRIKLVSLSFNFWWGMVV